MSKHLFMHHGEISDGGGDGDPAGPWGGGDGGGDEVQTGTEVEEEMEVMEMKMVWILLLGGLSNPDLAEKNGPAGGGGGKNRANFESKLYLYHGTRARKTGAQKVREKRVGVWSFWGAFLFEKR